jgi:hypothetical protein
MPTVKGFGLRDKPRMHRYIQLLVRGKPMTSKGLFKWTKQVSPKGKVKTIQRMLHYLNVSFLRVSTVWAAV